MLAMKPWRQNISSSREHKGWFTFHTNKDEVCVCAPYELVEDSGRSISFRLDSAPERLASSLGMLSSGLKALWAHCKGILCASSGNIY